MGESLCESVNEAVLADQECSAAQECCNEQMTPGDGMTLLFLGPRLKDVNDKDGQRVNYVLTFSQNISIYNLILL